MPHQPMIEDLALAQHLDAIARHCAASPGTRRSTAPLLAALEALLRDHQGMSRTISDPDGATNNAFDAIAKACGCETWEYPGQVVRDVQLVVDALNAIAKRFDCEDWTRPEQIVACVMAECGGPIPAETRAPECVCTGQCGHRHMLSTCAAGDGHWIARSSRDAGEYVVLGRNGAPPKVDSETARALGIMRPDYKDARARRVTVLLRQVPEALSPVALCDFCYHATVALYRAERAETSGG